MKTKDTLQICGELFVFCFFMWGVHNADYSNLKSMLVVGSLVLGGFVSALCYRELFPYGFFSDGGKNTTKHLNTKDTFK